MDVKPGYKQTEMGVMPEDWDLSSLGEIAVTYSGGTPNTSKTAYFGNEIPWITSGDLNRHIISEVPKGLTPAGFANSSAKMVQSGTVLIALYGATAGVVALSKMDAAINQAVLAVRPKKDESVFLYQYLKSRRGQVVGTFTQGGQPNLSGAILRSIPVPLPPIQEQRAIATALSEVDALITKLDQLIAKKRDIKQAAMQQLLNGKTRLPGFMITFGTSREAPEEDICGVVPKPGYKHTEVGIIPEGWDVTEFGKCLEANPSYGINAPAVTFSDRLPTYIRITDITDDGRFLPSPRVSVCSEMSNNYYLEEGDIVFARTGASVGKSYKYNLDDGRLVYAGFLIRARPAPQKLLAAFAAAYVKTFSYWRWVHLMSMRSGQPGINGREFAQLPIPLPPLSEQRAIATVLSDMDAEIAALEARRHKTKALKQGMMQELLTGRVRLPVNPERSESVA